MSRRRFLAVGGAAVVGGAAALVAVMMREPVGRSAPGDAAPGEAAPGDAGIRGLMAAPEVWERVGRRALDVGAVTGPAGALAARVAPEGEEDPQGWITSVSADVFGAAFSARAESDFAAGRIVALDGWRLGEAEVALAALAALTPGLLAAERET